MTDKHSVWMQDLLGEVKRNPTEENIKLIESCGKCCAMHQGHLNVAPLKEAAGDCKTKSDYVEFFNETFPFNAEEADDGIIIHFGKTECTCPLAREITENAEALCYCTQGHEKAMWGEFFGREIDAVMIETILRGGDDCIVKLII